jgi:hypothetical protein
MITPIELYTEPKPEWGRSGDMTVRYARDISVKEVVIKINEIIEVLNKYDR